MNISTQLRTAMRYGAFSGLSSFIVAIIVYSTGKNPLGTMSWLGFWIPILFIILGIQHHRDKDLGGFIGYGRGVGTGLLITLFTATIFSILIYAFCTFIGTDILEVHKTEMLEHLEQAKSLFGESFYEKGVEETEQLTTGIMVMDDFRMKVAGGVFLSLIIAAFLRKRKSIFEPTQE